MSAAFLRWRPYLGYRANQVRDYINDVHARDGQPPSYGMICKHLGIATKGEVSRIVANLERRGFLKRAGSGRERRIRMAASR